METPSRDTISTLCRLVKEAGLREDHHSIGSLLDFIRSQKSELEEVEAALVWVMQDNQVTTSMYLGPAIKELSTRAAEAALEEARESTTTKHGGNHALPYSKSG